MRRTRMAAVGAMLAAALLAGCSEEPAPTLTPPPVPEYAPPAVTEEHAQEILDDVELTILEADAAGDAELLAPRVTGAAQEFRRAEYNLASVSGGESGPKKLWTDSALTVVTATDGWPRSILAVSQPTAGDTRRLLLGLVQDGPRDPYRLVAWSSMLPSATTPTFPAASVGTAPVTADQAGLSATPTEALTWLAASATDIESESSAHFADDPYRERVRQELADLKQAAEAAGEVSWEWTPGEIVFGVGTADGGALVMGTLDTVMTMRKTIDGAKLNLGGEWAWFVGGDPVDAAVTGTYKTMVTLYIPPAGSEDLIQLVGAERVMTGAERVE
ncbi:MAG: hypothetical protein J0H73_16540 [Salana multivorans]|uniref:hypothetical protein n=1 Tax=Salana multivorans TaxID=120377 RepID=UPI000AE7B1D8|nr:hypothetical protein [Salana multivorans]MBN8883904.1 hypothetical protein [Salana multivorans]